MPPPSPSTPILSSPIKGYEYKIRKIVFSDTLIGQVMGQQLCVFESQSIVSFSGDLCLLVFMTKYDKFIWKLLLKIKADFNPYITWAARTLAILKIKRFSPLQIQLSYLFVSLH